MVNEPSPHTTPTNINGMGGSGNSGWDWIAHALKGARQACPNAVFILNDYNNVRLSGDVQHDIDIVKAIKSAGAPIDAVGCQTHGAANPPSSTRKANIDKLARGTGLPVTITEYDLGIADANKQKQAMQDQFAMFWSNSNVKGISVWGYIVGSTWLANAGLMQSDGTMRPATTWRMEFLGRLWLQRRGQGANVSGSSSISHKRFRGREASTCVITLALPVALGSSGGPCPGGELNTAVGSGA